MRFAPRRGCGYATLIAEPITVKHSIVRRGFHHPDSLMDSIFLIRCCGVATGDTGDLTSAQKCLFMCKRSDLLVFIMISDLGCVDGIPGMHF